MNGAAKVPGNAESKVTGCVCDLRLPCGVHLREQRTGEARQSATVAPPGRYRNTEGLRGHANARKRADS